MDGQAGREVPLKRKYREPKPKGKNRASYMGNSGISRHTKHVLLPMVPGIKRKRIRGRMG